MIIKLINRKHDIKLRERCVKYALKFNPSSPGVITRIEELIHDSQELYDFITRTRHFPTIRHRK